MLKQTDFWDSVNLTPGGQYKQNSRVAALNDLLNQLSPKRAGARVIATPRAACLLHRAVSGALEVGLRERLVRSSHRIRLHHVLLVDVHHVLGGKQAHSSASLAYACHCFVGGVRQGAPLRPAPSCRRL